MKVRARGCAFVDPARESRGAEAGGPFVWGTRSLATLSDHSILVSAYAEVQVLNMR